MRKIFRESLLGAVFLAIGLTMAVSGYSNWQAQHSANQSLSQNGPAPLVLGAIARAEPVATGNRLDNLVESLAAEAQQQRALVSGQPGAESAAPEAEPAPAVAIPPAQAAIAPIVTYHYIQVSEANAKRSTRLLSVSPRTLERQLQQIRQLGLTPLTVSQLRRGLTGEMPLPDEPIALTFDDGYRDFYTEAFPLLRKYNAPATIFVVTGFLDQPRYLTKAMVREIDASGLVEIGAHTVHHKDLRTLSALEQAAEIDGSRMDLEALLGHSIASFAYPYGGYTQETRLLVERSGFQIALTTKRGALQEAGHLFELRRVYAFEGQDFEKVIPKWLTLEPEGYASR